MDPLIYIPVALYLIFAGLFIQQGLTNVFLVRMGVSSPPRYLINFIFSSALFCLVLLIVILSPQLGLSADQTRWAFYICWLVAPVVGYLYVLTLAEHLGIERRRIRWITAAYSFDLTTTIFFGVYTLVTDQPLLFSYDQGATQSLIDLHIGGVFSPSDITIVKIAIINVVVLLSAIFFIREIFRREAPDFSLIFGLTLTAAAIVTETLGYALQWRLAFSLLPLANAAETLRLTYLQSLSVGQALESSRLRVRRDRLQMKAHLSALSHDVRTPLTSLKIGLGRLSAEGQDTATAQVLAREVEYMHVVFGNLLTLFELELKDIKPALTPADLRPSLETLSRRFLNLAHSRGVNVDVADDLDRFSAAFDATTFEQVVGNLMYNGINHARAKVAVSAYREGAELVIRILDDGPPLEGVIIPQLSDRVYRSQLEQRIGCAGWGLSAAIAHALVELQGGQLSLTTDPDGFTQFELRLPAGLEIEGASPRPIDR